MIQNGIIKIRRCRDFNGGHLNNGSFWLNDSVEDNGVIEIYCESNKYNISGLGGFLNFFGKDKSRKHN